jgi:serine/threonine protein kinase
MSIIFLLIIIFLEDEPGSKMTEEKSRYYFQQIIMAVEYCHSLKIIHRDLKPENILIDKKNNCIKISDFGLSTSIQTNDQLIPDIAGTTSYLAPEVIKQTGYLGQSADIWSAGVILFNCVTGSFPFYASDSGQLLNNILSAKVSYPKYLSKPIIDLFKHIFIVSPRNRYTIEQIKVHPWFKEYNNIFLNIIKFIGI